MVERDDPELVAAIARGDERAFAAIYRRHLPLVLRWCLRETGNRELAADLCAEVFAASLTAARRYRPERGEVLAWLLGIARNKLRESRRRGRVEDVARRRMGIDPSELTDDDLERVLELASLDAGAVGALVDLLPEELRRPLLERVVAERPYAEIAAELRCSELVVRQRVSRGLKRLRSEMEEPR
jgi:RNA polymerase sigma-70 factor (ECF subfamily)